MLEVGSEIALPRSGGRWRVHSLLGEGGQGAVFRIDPLDSERSPLAVKWYHPRAATGEQRAAIERLVARGAPGPMFLWPSETITAEQGDDAAEGFGYAMPLRTAPYRPIGELLLGRVESTPRLALTLALGLAHAFLLLHVEGLCYRDISFGNVFFDPVTGAPLICDNDNVGIDGASYTGVLGTRRFMAPEVVRGDALPSAQTDLHSLAVLLFFVLAHHHPLIGGLESRFRGREGELELLGRHPLFIFDPDDERNRPDPVTQPAPTRRWSRLPDSLQSLFMSAFTKGLGDPVMRVRESIWRSTLATVRDGIHECGWCGAQNLSDAGSVARCVSCRRPMPPPVQLIGEHARLTVNSGTELLAHHLRRDYDFDTRVGAIVHDESRDRWGLRNLSRERWAMLRSGRDPEPVGPGQTVMLIEGARLLIGRSRFEVRTAQR